MDPRLQATGVSNVKMDADIMEYPKTLPAPITSANLPPGSSVQI